MNGSRTFFLAGLLALLTATSAACGPHGAASAPVCGSSQLVGARTVYVVDDPGTWSDPSDPGAGDPGSDPGAGTDPGTGDPGAGGDPGTGDPSAGTDPGTGDDGGSNSGDDGSDPSSDGARAIPRKHVIQRTPSLRVATYGTGHTTEPDGNGCYRCLVTCSLASPAPGLPNAGDAMGVSAMSYSNACDAARLELDQWAASQGSPVASCKEE